MNWRSTQDSGNWRRADIQLSDVKNDSCAFMEASIFHKAHVFFKKVALYTHPQVLQRRCKYWRTTTFHVLQTHHTAELYLTPVLFIGSQSLLHSWWKKGLPDFSGIQRYMEIWQHSRFINYLNNNEFSLVGQLQYCPVTMSACPVLLHCQLVLSCFFDEVREEWITCN